LPITLAPSGTSFTTTAPAPTTQPSPTLMPGRSTAPAPDGPAGAAAPAEPTPRAWNVRALDDDEDAMLAFLIAHEAPADLFARIVVLGASVSHGHGLSREAGRPVGFADVLDAALLGEHGEVHGYADWFFFDRSLTEREAMVRRALEREPTLLVAPDFLFWYAYGAVGQEEQRPWMFEKALALLDEFPGTVLVGDLPWLERAVGRTDGLYPGLQPYQLPPRETVEQLNGRLARWAYARPHVVVLPLADFVERLLAGDAVDVGDNHWDAGPPERLLLADWLHPRLEGSAALALSCLRALHEGRPGWDAARIEPDVQRVVARVLGEEE